jgi:ribosome-associated heat shock protein Hsp15
MAEKIRIDKWLWSVRIFKSRTMATDACKASKVKLNDVIVKPSALVAIGNNIEVKRNGFSFTFKVQAILKSRVSALLAAPCYLNTTSQEELDKYKNWFVGKGASEMRERGTGRPTKRERREIDDFKDNSLTLNDMWDAEEE